MKKLLLTLFAFFALSFGALAAVNLNTATKEELDTVKGIGPVKAQAIIDYRREHGSFKSVDDLKNVKGFGEKSVARMRAELTVTGATTARSEPAQAEKAQVKKEEKAGKEGQASKPGRDQTGTEKKGKEDKKDKKKAKKEKKKQGKDGKQDHK